MTYTLGRSNDEATDIQVAHLIKGLREKNTQLATVNEVAAARIGRLMAQIDELRSRLEVKEGQIEKLSTQLLSEQRRRMCLN
jgi:TolA-binding protein